MTNATKTLAIIFAVLVVFTIATKWSSGPAASHAFRTNLVDVDTTQIDKMVIDHPTNATLTMKKNKNQWQVSGKGENYPADAKSVLSAVNELNNLEVNAVTTRNPEKFTRYKVDSTGIKVSMYDGNEMLSSIYVGAPQRAGRRSLNNYVRPADEEAVYSVKGLLRSTFSKGVDEWRDKQVWKVKQSDISRVDFLYQADSSFTIKKEKQKWLSSGDTLSNSSVSSVVSRLANPSANGFADSIAVDDFGNEKYAIQIELTDGKQHRLQLKESPSDDSIYLAASNDFPYVFTLRKSTWDNNVLKPRSELLKTSNK